MSESVKNEVSRLENGGVGKKIRTIALVVAKLTNFSHLYVILPILNLFGAILTKIGGTKSF